MKAAYIRRTGPADVIEYGELPRPVPKGSEVLIKVGAVSVNPIDTYLRNGANYWPLPQPFIIGCDVAGTVVEAGPMAHMYRAGDRVWGSNQGLMGRQGTFAEYCAIDENWLYPTPNGIPDTTAAACALVGITAHLGLFQIIRLKKGETLLVHGGSGGVGSMVLQMAKTIGARVIATSSSEAGAALCKDFGAVGVIHHKLEDECAAVKGLAPNGVDVIWETQREPNFDQLVTMLAERGRIVLMAGRDARPPFPVGPFYVKGCSLHGFVMFKFSMEEQRICAEDINHFLEKGTLKPVIGRILPLSQAAEAHRLQEQNTLQKSGTLMGKIVLVPES